MANPAKVAEESVSVFKRGQKALLDRLQKMVDDGASKADLKKAAGNAANAKPGPGVIDSIKAAEARAIDWVTRQKRFKTGQPYSIGKGGGAVPKGAKDIRVKRGVARTIVYGGGATALGTAGNAVSGRPTAKEVRDSTKETDAEKAARLKKRREDQARVNAGNPGSPGNEIKKGKLFKKFRPFGGVIARALLGDDEKFGGERGMIDFIRLKKKKNKTPAEKAKIKAAEAVEAAKEKTKSAKTKAAAASKKASGLKNGGMAKKPVKKNMGGMMKKKGYSKGGAAKKKKGYAMGGMAKKGYSKGGAMKKKGYAMGGQASKFPDLNKDGKVTQADILKGRGVAKKNMGGSMKKKGYAMGGMTKKGYANGGMAKKGYAKGGPAKKTTAKKTSSRGKARGVGAATRGYGRAMKK